MDKEINVRKRHLMSLVRSCAQYVACLASLVVPCNYPKIALAQELSELTRVARTKGQSSVDLIGSTDLLGSSETVATLDKEFSVVEVLSTGSYVERGTSSIRTWYSFKLTNVLRQGSNCIFCDGSIRPPESAFRHLATGAILVPTPGGKATLDGIEIKYHSNASVSLSIGTQYLMVLANIRPSDKIYFLSAGPSGVFKIDPNGALHGIGASKSPLRESIEQFGSITALRAYLLKH